MGSAPERATADGLGSPAPCTLVVDDHPVMRAGLQALLSAHDWLGAIVEAGSVAQVRDLTARLRPTWAVVDLRLPDGDGYEVLRLLGRRVPACKSLVLTMSSGLAAAQEAFDCGARGFLEKDCDPGLVVDALRTIADGGLVLGQSDMGSVARAGLTPREIRILGMVAEGAANPLIAHRLKVTEKTIRNQVSSILTKLGVRSRVELALLARDRGWV